MAPKNIKSFGDLGEIVPMHDAFHLRYLDQDLCLKQAGMTVAAIMTMTIMTIMLVSSVSL